MPGWLSFACPECRSGAGGEARGHAGSARARSENLRGHQRPPGSADADPRHGLRSGRAQRAQLDRETTGARHATHKHKQRRRRRHHAWCVGFLPTSRSAGHRTASTTESVTVNERRARTRPQPLPFEPSRRTVGYRDVPLVVPQTPRPQQGRRCSTVTVAPADVRSCRWSGDCGA